MRHVRLLCGALATSLLLPCGGGRAQDAAGSASARPPSQIAIDAAVARGVSWLRKQQRTDGSFGAAAGETALALLALRHSGAPSDDPTCVRAELSLVRELPDDTTYGASLGIAALLSQAPAKRREKVTALTADLVRAQCANGQWTYATGKSAKSPSGDNSNTQFAVFALAAARAAGISVPKETFGQCREFLRATRNEDGGWGYAAKQRTRSYAAMTAGCASSFALCGELPPADPRLTGVPEVRAALAWLGAKFEPGANTGAALAFGAKKGRRGDDFHVHYWLWSLERACSTLGASKLSGRDWYAEGAGHLLSSQRDDGAWLGPERDVIATPFALLFFARGTLRVVTPSGDAVVPAVTPR